METGVWVVSLVQTCENYTSRMTIAQIQLLAGRYHVRVREVVDGITMFGYVCGIFGYLSEAVMASRQLFDDRD